jgi:hypothetical protein
MSELGFKSSETSNATKYACAILMIIMTLLAFGTTFQVCFQHRRRAKNPSNFPSRTEGAVIEYNTPELLEEAYHRPLEVVTKLPISHIEAVIVRRRIEPGGTTVGQSIVTAGAMSHSTKPGIPMSAF